ncbi:triacylglycerol lipase [Polyrhizophydium stewartii]|uniref:Triacylglycerol lipase n=1 Tax=Polyrhizophydium stewartii TaxID=2732419 RepID=A0ABR4N4J6_9FUNG
MTTQRATAKRRPPPAPVRFVVRSTAQAADLVLGAVMMLLDASGHRRAGARGLMYWWWTRIVTHFNARAPDEVLGERLSAATTYEQWLAVATELDMLHGNHLWKVTQATNLYDHKLIYSRLQSLRAARDSGDVSAMIYLLRSGLLRNLGGLADVRLFTHSFTGTKTLIDDYLEEVVLQLNIICDTEFENLTLHQKWELFSDTRQSFGNTALLLQGGATFGMYHLGVVKALSEHGLLPRIISGSSVGALIAALVCVHTDAELPGIFLPNGIDLAAFAHKDAQRAISRKIARLLKHGYLLDVKVLEDCVRSNLGDMTFEVCGRDMRLWWAALLTRFVLSAQEAFHRTGKVLNITVTSSRKGEVPQLLNYLTAPNVLIRSAACASVALVGLYRSVDLLAKDRNGHIFIWSPLSVRWTPGTSNVNIESPETRLAELFNVNHFIVSQANPYIAPFVSTKNASLSNKLIHMVQQEIRHRLNQVAELGLFPQTIISLFGQKAQGHVTIAPQLSSMDFYTIFSNPTYRSLSYWILKGEQSTWPNLSFIKNRTIVEMTLYEVTSRLRSTIERVQRERDNPRSRRHEEAKRRNKSIA